MKIKKAFNDCDRCIFFSVNNSFAGITCVAIESIIESSSLEEKYDIIVLHSELDDDNIKNLESFSNANNISVRCVDISEIVSNVKFYTKNRTDISKETYYRLFMPWIIEDGYKRALYLDGDMIINININEMFNIDISNYYIAGVRDYWGICDCYSSKENEKYRKEIGISDTDNYIIAATLLFNISKIKSKFSIETIKEIIYSRKWKQHDQDIINVIFKEHIKIISIDWGMMDIPIRVMAYLPKKLQDEIINTKSPKIYHYATYRKPWIFSFHKESDVFWEHAIKTPYFYSLFNLMKDIEYKHYIGEILNDKGFNVKINRARINIDKFKFRDNKLIVQGDVCCYDSNENTEIRIILKNNNKSYNPIRQYKGQYKNSLLNKDLYFIDNFEFSINVIPKIRNDLEFFIFVDNKEIVDISYSFNRFCTINNKFDNQYYYYSKHIAYFENNHIIIQPCCKIKHLTRELSFLRELISKATNRKDKIIVLYRMVVFILKPFFNKEIWLISDRVGVADDNGEAFFKFLSTKRDKIIKYFVIPKNAEDFERLKQYGKVIDPNSFKHKLLIAFSSKIISSQTDIIYRSIAPYHSYKICDYMSDNDFVFLQHGIILSSLTKWLNRKEQCIDAFVVSTKNEYKDIASEKYGYNEEETWATGLARFDYLKNNSQKIITFMPTWRRYLSPKCNQNTGTWTLANDIKESKYIKNYRDLLNNKRLNEYCKNNGYTIQFKIHPSIRGNEKIFDFNDDIKILDKVAYNKIYEQSCLVVTDYSSSVHDFLYLHKPVIYFQFDKEEFYGGGHATDETIIDYENKGYGEVEYTVESVVDRIIEYLENGCKLKEKYQKRFDDNIFYIDNNNCERIYSKIIEMNK